jgi:putative transcriptional regulator
MTMRIRMALAELLEERGRSLYWLTKQIGTDYTTMHRFKSGKARGVTFDMLGRICTALECTPGNLLVLADEKSDNKKKSKAKS